MRIAFGLRVDDAGDGAVRVCAADWQWAAILAVPALAAGLPLVVWSAATAHWIELGGGAVFCAFGATAAWLGLAKRRDVLVRGSSVRGREGAWPFARGVNVEWAGRASLSLRPFPVPGDAPDLDDRGGDLVIAASGSETLLARRAGPGWRTELEAARARLVERIPALG
jgi:hypothetical protein